MTHRLSRTTVLVAIALLACAILFFVSPGTAHATPLQLPLPGWLQDMLDQLEIALVKTLQDTARVGGVLLWGVLKGSGLVSLFGDGFFTLFGTVITEALNAVMALGAGGWPSVFPLVPYTPGAFIPISPSMR